MRKPPLPLPQQIQSLRRSERVWIALLVAGVATLGAAAYTPELRLPGFVLLAMGVIGIVFWRILQNRLKQRIAAIKAHGDIGLRRKLFADKPQEFRVLSRENFEGADYFFYDNTKRALELHGFVFLGDIENVTISKTVPRARTFNRILRSNDATVAVELRHTRTIRPAAPDQYTIAFRSEQNGNHFLITTNTGGNTTSTAQEPGSTVVCFPAKTPCEEILRIHLEALALLKIVRPLATWTRVHSIDDYIQLSQRLHSLISRREAERGFQKIDPKTLAAKRILDQQKAIYSPAPQEYRVANLAELTNIDVAFYDRIRDEAIAHGFRHLCDWENMSLSRIFPHMRTFLRAMISSDGSIGAAAYQIRNLDTSHRVFAVGAEFSDGTFLECTTARQQFAHFPGIDLQHFPSTISFGELLEIHRQRVAEKLASSPGLAIVPGTTIEECLAAQQRQHAMKARHKQATGYFNESDMRLIRGRALTPHETAILSEVERLKNAPTFTPSLPAQPKLNP